ncbi:MAG: hypothetical protein ACK410_09510 [Acinetobacter sp.]
MASCFVVMAIGDQYDWNNNLVVSQDELKANYDALIKEAINSANPELEVLRADESLSQGMISSDIMTKLMFSDFVVVDITYPNPNVFYELGLRHACKAKGTIIIKDKNSKSVPFDISHLRYIEYTNTPAGLKQLKENLKATFFEYSTTKKTYDNQFQEQAKLTNFEFPSYAKLGEAKAKVLNAFIETPEMIDMLAQSDPQSANILKLMAKMPNSQDFISAIASELEKE